MLVAPRIALAAALMAVLLLCAAVPAFARPDALATTAMVKKKAAKKQLTCKQVKRARNARKLSRSQRKRLAAARRRCAAAQRKTAAKKKSSSGGTAPGAPSSGGSSDPGGATGTGGAGTGIPTPDPAPPGDYTAPLPESNPHALQVISGEFFLNLSRSGVLSGPVRVEFNNAYAEDPHDLHLVREDGNGQSYAFGQLESGQIEAKSLDLSEGSWQLFCALPQHASYGMTATLRVTDG